MNKAQMGAQIDYLARRVDELSRICAESYQVIGVLADEAGRFNDPLVIKAMDNASRQELQHEDVLPFGCADMGAPVKGSKRERRRKRSGFFYRAIESVLEVGRGTVNAKAKIDPDHEKVMTPRRKFWDLP